MQFSVIVPVYKVEKYLKSCVESILAQTFHDYEIILVDDGSPDNCGAICDEYSAVDDRIKVIHKSNGGLSSARNAGLEVAGGDYILFLDSDDELCEGILKTISDRIEKYPQLDILVGNIIHHYPNELKKVIEYDNLLVTGDDSLDQICERFALKRYQLPWRAYQSVYKRNYIEKNNLRYDESIVGAEDCAFFVNLCELKPEAKLFDFCTVVYRAFREDSIIHTVSYKSVIGQLSTFYRAYEKAGIFSNADLLKSYFASRYANIIILANQIDDKQERLKCYEFINERKEILKFCFNEPRYIVAKMLWTIFGFEKGSKLLLHVKRRRMQ